MSRPRKIAPTRAKRSGESVAKKRIAGPPLVSLASASSPSASASATAAAVVSAESTSATRSPTVRRMACANTGKCVQPSTSVSGASAPRTAGRDNARRSRASLASPPSPLRPERRTPGRAAAPRPRPPSAGEWPAHRRRLSPSLRSRSRRCACSWLRRRRPAHPARSRRSPAPGSRASWSARSATADAVLQAITTIFTPSPRRRRVACSA